MFKIDPTKNHFEEVHNLLEDYSNYLSLNLRELNDLDLSPTDRQLILDDKAIVDFSKLILRICIRSSKADLLLPSKIIHHLNKAAFYIDVEINECRNDRISIGNIFTIHHHLIDFTTEYYRRRFTYKWWKFWM